MTGVYVQVTYKGAYIIAGWSVIKADVCRGSDQVL